MHDDAPSQTAPADNQQDPPKRRLWLRRAFICSQLVLGLGLGLWGAEYMFAKRAEGAFPHVNFYVPDAELGVRLEPGAEMVFRLGENPLTKIHVNTNGFRGPEWPEPTPDAAPGTGEIVVVGDSQVFGLGVNDDETFSARLAELSGRTVINAGVPTYGPLEYMATTEELLEQRKPQTVVYVLNFLNDPFELERPNTERHAVWDGWAVRKESAPEEGSITEFPGRKWLMSKSHAMYAARRWMYEQGRAELPNHAQFGFPSEGGWRDLISEGAASLSESQTKVDEAQKALAQKRERLGKLGNEIDEARFKLDGLIAEASDYEWGRDERRIARGQPGDILDDQYSEAARSILVTASMIRQASRARKKYLDKLLAKEAKRGKTDAKTLVAQQEKLKAEGEALRRDLAAGRVAFEHQPSVFEPHLEQLAELCATHGAELVVVALPVDIQVSADEWAKYGVDPDEQQIDMQPSLALLDDLIASGQRVGARGLNATEALKAAGPGAFLIGDIHMTAKGHAALAQAIADTLDAPPPLRLPRAGLPQGRTLVPEYKRFIRSREQYVKGSSKAGCSTHRIDEWFKVRCVKPRPRVKPPSGVEVVTGGTEETMTLVTEDSVSLLTPLTPGTPLTARFYWENKVRDLNVTWEAGEDGKPAFHGQFVDVADATGRPLEVGDIGKRMCTCQHDVHNEKWGTQDNDWLRDERNACREVWGEPHPGCMQAYAKDCEKLLACAQGDPLVAPACPPGQIHVTARHLCRAPCDEHHPCQQGTCTPYNGGGYCS